MADLLQCKATVQYLAETKNVKMAQLLLKKWSDFKEIVAVMRIPYKATIALQKQDLTLSDAYGIWLKINIHLQAVAKKRLCKTNFATCLSKALDERKKTIFNNPAMLGAIYLDPRFRCEILRDQQLIDQSIKTLLNLWRRIITLSGDSANESILSSTKESCDLNFSADFDNPDILDKYLSRANGSIDMQQNATSHILAIEEEIELFNAEKLPSNASIISYWESAKEQNQRLYELAKVIYAIPPTEVQIERDFSTLEFIFSQRRQRLSAEMLEAILTLNLNSDIFYIIKNEKLLRVRDENINQ